MSNNNIIPRMGNTLFSPQNSEVGFNFNSGGVSRRKFLKRTGGATAAAALALRPANLQAQQNNEESESERWVMDLVEQTGDVGVEKASKLLTLIGANDSLDVTFHLKVMSVATGGPLTDTNTVTLLSRFSAWVEGEGIPTGAATPGTEFEIQSTVSCDPSNGHITASAQYLPGPHGTGPATSVTFNLVGKQFKVTVTGGISIGGQGARELTHLAVGKAKIEKVGEVPFYLPDPADKDKALGVTNKFKSKKVVE